MSAAGPDGEGLGAIVARLRALAAPGADRALLAPQPAHPDAVLLDTLAHALRCQAEIARFDATIDYFVAERRRGLVLNPATARQQAEIDSLVCERLQWMEDGRKALRRAGKMPARTGVGLYAKALAARQSGSGSAGLCRSIADDLAALPALRALLWPVAVAS